MTKLTPENFILASGASAVGLIFRAQENIALARIAGQLAFYKATAITEDRFYGTGRLVGTFDNIVLVSVEATVHVLEDGIEPLIFTANKEPTGPQVLKNASGKTLTPEDFAHDGEYHILLAAALHARGHCRLPAVRRQASPDSVVIDYAKAA